MGGRTGDMMYSRGYGVGERGKRMPTELMTAPGMKKGGKVKKKKKQLMMKRSTTGKDSNVKFNSRGGMLKKGKK